MTGCRWLHCVLQVEPVNVELGQQDLAQLGLPVLPAPGYAF